MREAIVTCKSRHWHDGHWVTCALLPGHRGWHSTTRREESRFKVEWANLMKSQSGPRS